MTVPLKALSDEVLIKFPFLCLLKLFILSVFSLQKLLEKFTEVNTFSSQKKLRYLPHFDQNNVSRLLL